MGYGGLIFPCFLVLNYIHLRQQNYFMVTGKLKSKLFPRLIRKAIKTKQGLTEAGKGNLGLIIDLNEADSEKLTRMRLPAEYEKDFRIVLCGSRQEEAKESGVVILDKKEISLGGKFEAQDIQEFLNEQFDFLICYLSEDCPEANLLAARSIASVRIGNYPDKFGVFDLVIEADTVDVFQKEALKYLRILKKNLK